MLNPRPLRAGQLVTRVTQEIQQVAIVLETHGYALGHVRQDAEHTHDRRRVDRGRTGLVIEAHVPTGDRNPDGRATVSESTYRLGELPHHGRILGRAEVEAVRDRDRLGS